MSVKPSPIEIAQEAYERDLDKAVDIVFEYATYVLNYSWADLAHEARLSQATVNRLGNRVTRLPRYQTFWKLARACGLTVNFVNRNGQVITKPKQLVAKTAA